uniref:Ig-like domain-containing protein n=1 Tax=Denticeps clupeoides TaxID=299321 RepID=A0AAY4C5I3_9TELE
MTSVSQTFALARWWFCEGKELENSPDIQIINNGELHSLIIAEAFEEDTGRYSCFASNFYGTDSTSAEIYIEGLDGRPIMAAPVFTKSLQDLYAQEGQLVVLECRVKGVPSPRVEWYREGTVIEDSPDFRILQKSKCTSHTIPFHICTLVIAEVFPEDSGTFTCTASNKYGTVSSIAGLKVKGKVLFYNIILNKCAVPLPDPPPSCLKPRIDGVLVNHSETRSTSRVGLRVHFKLPEEEEDDADASSTHSQDDMYPMSANKEPPPVLAKPKLDAVQLQLLHNQVLLEQQQESSPQENPTWSDKAFHEPLKASSQTLYHHKPRPAPFVYPGPTPQFNTIPTPLLNTTPSPMVTPKGSTLTPVNAITTSQMPQIYMAAPTHLSTVTVPNLNMASMFPTRVLEPPTSPPAYISSPTLVPPAFRNSAFILRPQSPPQASSPTSSSSTPSPIQNPVAFLSSVLPSLPTSPPTNAMGLPKSAPALSHGTLRKTGRGQRPVASDDIHESREALLHDIEKKLCFKDDLMHHHRPQEYKVSSFEQRLMSEIEFRLERTPVEESDDEVQHEEIPTGKCIAPIFDKKLKNFRAMEGVPVTFTCKVVGIPIPKVYWFKDGKQVLKRNERYRKIREGDGTCSLHIETITNDDDGNYTVMAANPQGRISCSGHLIVQTGPVRNRLPMIHSQRVRTRVQEAEGEPVLERFFRPHFLQAPGDMVAHEGKLCRLDCKVSGLPNPELMWLVKGKPIYPDSNHRMLVRENGIHSLIIDPLTQNDGGTYTCIASNKVGQSSFCLELLVVEREVKQAPQFVEKLQNTGIAEGTPVRLECRVVGMPPPIIFWKKDNETIPHSMGRVSVHQDATGYICLLIQPTRKEDAGWYTVSAKNDVGIVSCTARLDIYAQWHKQVPQPMKKATRPGSRYAALTGQGLDIKSAFLSSDNCPILFSSSPTEATLESEEL